MSYYDDLMKKVREKNTSYYDDLKKKIRENSIPKCIYCRRPLSSSLDDFQKWICYDCQKIPRCPKCGSTSIQIVNKKWGLIMGFATNKTKRVCANCCKEF